MSQTLPVLLLCDHPLAGGLLHRALEEAGWPCTWLASEGVAGLPAGSYQAVVLDLVLVQPNGFALLRQLRQDFAGPILLFSATGRASDLAWGDSAGATAVLAYPASAQQFQHWLGTASLTAETADAVAQ